MRKCPFCAEDIQDEAIKCRYCSSNLQSSTGKDYEKPILHKSRHLTLFWWILGVLFLIWLNIPSSTHHYTDCFHANGTQTKFTLTHKYVSGTLKVYISDGHFRDLVNSGVDYQECSDGKCIIAESISLDYIKQNVPEKAPYPLTEEMFEQMSKHAQEVVRKAPKVPYPSGWIIEVEYDSKK